MARRALIAAALLATLSASPAFAQQGGAVACLQDARKLQAYLNQNSDKLSPERRRDAQERLAIANDQCRSEPLLGQVNLSALRQSLTQETQQQATVPPAAGEPQDKGY